MTSVEVSILGHAAIHAPGGVADLSGTFVTISSLATTLLGYSRPSLNLSDLASASTARTNLGLGTAATQASTAFDSAGAATAAQAAAIAASLQKSSNLSDLANVTTARSNLGLGTAALVATTSLLQVSNNLSDLASAATARTNLGLGTLATISPTGTANSTTILYGDNVWRTAPSGGGGGGGSSLYAPNPFTTSKTLVTADLSTFMTTSSASDVILTVPSTLTSPAGAFINVLQKGAGRITIAFGSGMTGNSPTGVFKTSGPGSQLTIWFESGSACWVDGDLAVS